MKVKLKLITKIISKALFTFLLIFLFVLAGYVVAIKVMQARGEINKVPLNMYVILTQSMYPKIKAGDMIITYKNDNNKYDIGDVITFISSDSFTNGVTITHRVQGITESNGKYMYRTKGDNNNSADSNPVSSDNVMGRVIVKIPKVGFAQQFLATKTGWIVAIVLPCLAIISFDIVKIFTRKKKIKKVEEKSEAVNSIPSESSNNEETLTETIPLKPQETRESNEYHEKTEVLSDFDLNIENIKFNKPIFKKEEKEEEDNERSI